MAREVSLLHQVTHDGQCHFAHVEAAQRAAAQAQNLQSDAIFSRPRVAIQVGLLLKSAENVTGGTLRNLEFTADIGVAKAFRLLGNRLQHSQSSFNSDGWRIGGGRHTKSLW